MSFQAKIKLTQFAALAVMIMLPFQNCAPAGGPQAIGHSSASVSASAGSDPNQPVTVIDDVNRTTALSFVQTAADFAPGAMSLALDGVCSSQQDGATLRWLLRDPLNATQIASDTMSCSLGSFHVELPVQALLQCGRVYSLEAHLGLGRMGTISVQRPCSQ